MPGGDQLEFASSYEAQAQQRGVDIDARIDPNLRSYMDSGDALFAGETIDSTNGKTREQVIADVRGNIISQLKKENAASLASAQVQSRRHREYSNDLARDITKAEKKRIQIRKNQDELNSIIANGRNRNFMWKFITSYHDKVAARRLFAIRFQKSYAAILQKTIEKANRWNDIENTYVENIYKKHYKKYDDIAKTWYQLTREYERPSALNPPQAGAAGAGAAVPQPAAAAVPQVAGQPQDALVPQDAAGQPPQAIPAVPGQPPQAIPAVPGQPPQAIPAVPGQPPQAIPAVPGQPPQAIPAVPGQPPQAIPAVPGQPPQAIPAVPGQPPQAAAAAPGQPPQADRREIPADAAKDIAEYTGVYDEVGMQAVLRSIDIDPTLQVTGDIFVIKDYKETRAGSANAADAATHIKKHRKMLMLSEEDGTTGLRKRFKFGRDFRGTLSKKQFTEEDKNTPTAVSFPQPADFYQTVLAEDAKLEADERDINGRYLVSEKSSDIVSAKVSETKQRVHGFYLNGQFVSDEQVAQGHEVAGKEDMSWWDRRKWGKLEKAEALRAAIRKSAFFQHVNARTIQFYSSYQADEDYVNTVNDVMAAGINDAASQNNPMSPNTAVSNLMANPNLMDGIPVGLLPQAIALYAKARLNPAAGQPLDLTDPTTDRVLKYGLNNHSREMSIAALVLLADDSDPKLWTLAKSIVLKNNSTAHRTRAKLEYLPKAGEAMRMALMEELANHQQTGSEFDAGNPLGILNSPGQRVYMEELNSRRGKGAWFKRNLLNGNIIRGVISAGEVGVSAVQNSIDADALRQAEKQVSDASTDAQKEAAAKNLEAVVKGIQAKEGDRAQTRAWFAYAQVSSNFSQMSSVLSIAGMGATAGITYVAGGDIAGNMGVARGITMDVFSASNMVSEAIKMILQVRQLCIYLYNKYRRKTPAERAAEQALQRRTLTDLDGSTLKQVLKFIDSLASFVGSIRSIAGIHVTSKGGPISGKDDNWGELLKSLGPIDLVITNIRRIVKIIDDIREIVVSNRRIGRIDSANTELETAITAFKSMNDPKDPQRDAKMQQFNADKQTRAQTGNATHAQMDAELGEAAAKNSQAQYFLSLTKAQTRKNRSQAGWNIASNVLGGLKDLAGLIPESMGGSIIKAGMSVLPKLTEFIGWAVGKLKYDRQNFNDNIAMMLGNAEYKKAPYFNEVLKRETGIVNKYYLVDLARIFMSIDTHAMLRNPNASKGEMDLAMRVVGTLYGNVNDESVRTIKLKNMLSYAGLDENTDWRALLRNSLTN